MSHPHPPAPAPAQTKPKTLRRKKSFQFHRAPLSAPLVNPSTSTTFPQSTTAASSFTHSPGRSSVHSIDPGRISRKSSRGSFRTGSHREMGVGKENVWPAKEGGQSGGMAGKGGKLRGVRSVPMLRLGNGKEWEGRLDVEDDHHHDHDADDDEGKYNPDSNSNSNSIGSSAGSLFAQRYFDRATDTPTGTMTTMTSIPSHSHSHPHTYTHMHARTHTQTRRQGENPKRNRSETFTTVRSFDTCFTDTGTGTGMGTGTNLGSGSPRSTSTSTIRLHLGDEAGEVEVTPRAWMGWVDPRNTGNTASTAGTRRGRRRSSEGSRESVNVPLFEPGETDRAVMNVDVKSGRALQRVVHLHPARSQGHGHGHAGQGSEEEEEEGEERLTEMSGGLGDDPRIDGDEDERRKARFLKRHSREYSHLYLSPGLQEAFQQARSGPGPVPAHEGSGQVRSDHPTSRIGVRDLSTVSPMETEDQRQARIVEEARREGREKRRSWVLAKAGLVRGENPLSPKVQVGPGAGHGRMGSLERFSSVLGSGRMEQQQPQRYTHERSSSMSGGLRPLSLVMKQERERKRASLNGMTFEPLGPALPLPEPVIEQAEEEEEEEDSDKLTEMTRSESSTTFALANQNGAEEAYISHARDWSNASSGRGSFVRGHGRGRGSGGGRSSMDSSSNGSISLSRSVSQRKVVSPSKQALPPHLRNFSTSSVSMSNSSMSSLGAVLGGNSESSCSSGEHLGGPRVLSPEAFNFRMSVAERERLANEKRESIPLFSSIRPDSRMTNSTFAYGSIRTESRFSLRGPTPDLGLYAEENVGPHEDRESRIRRRRARAFLVAGLKLENNNSTLRSSHASVVAEQDEDWPKSPDESKKWRRGGIMVEENLGIGEEVVETMDTPRPVERKRYSAMLRDRVPKSDDDFLPTRRAGTPLMPFYLNSGSAAPAVSPAASAVETTYHSAVQSPANTTQEQPAMIVSSPLTLEPAAEPLASPGITISVIEETGNSYPVDINSANTTGLKPFPRDDSDNTLDTSAWRAQSGEMIRELFWLPGAQQTEDGSLSPGEPVVRKAKSDMGLQAAFREEIPTVPRRSMSRPPSPALIHSDSAGASPGRERKTSWSDAAKGWLRSETKTTPEVEVEKGFGLGRGRDTTNTPITIHPTPEVASPRPTRDQPPLKEKKSWKYYLGGSTGKKRRGSLPEAFKANFRSSQQPLTISLPDQAHVRRSTEPYSQACSGTSQQQLNSPSPTMLSPPAFPTMASRLGANHFSPLSAVSFSPQTPEYLPTSLGTRVGILPTPMRHANGQKQNDILSPTSGISHDEEHLQSYSSRNSFSEPSLPSLVRPDYHYNEKYDPSPSRMDMSGKLYGLGLEPYEPQPPASVWKGKGRAEPRVEVHNWDQSAADQTVGLIQVPRSADTALFGSTLTSKLGLPASILGRRPNIGIHAQTSPNIMQAARRDVSNSTASHTVSGTLDSPMLEQKERPQQYTITDVQDAHRDQAMVTNMAHADSNVSSVRSVVLKHETRILPAKLFFVMGFLLGPWVWLLGGWALSPAGNLLPSTHLPIGSRHRSQVTTRPITEYRPKGFKSVLPPINRDKPEKWVKRNRLAAVASSAVFIPAMCVGFGYLGHLL